MEPTSIKTKGSKVEVRSKIEINGNEKPSIEKKIKIDGEKIGGKDEEKNFAKSGNNLKDGNRKKPEISEKAGGKWIRVFLENLKSFFQNIFSIF